MKASAMLVALGAPLRFMPPELLRAVDQFLFQWCQGLDPDHDKRWRRMWRRAFHSHAARPVLTIYEVQDRSGSFHARHMAIEGRVFDNQDGFLTRAAFRHWLKTGAAFGRYVATTGGLVFEPSSCSYDECSDDEMREFHADAMEFLRTPAALATLWPQVRPDERLQMLETVIRNPDEQEP